MIQLRNLFLIPVGKPSVFLKNYSTFSSFLEFINFSNSQEYVRWVFFYYSYLVLGGPFEFKTNLFFFFNEIYSFLFLFSSFYLVLKLLTNIRSLSFSIFHDLNIFSSYFLAIYPDILPSWRFLKFFLPYRELTLQYDHSIFLPLYWVLWS